MTDRKRDYLMLLAWTVVMVLVVWHYWPALMSVEGVPGLPR